MPTKKPRVQVVLEKEIYEKFKILCKKENRTESSLGGYIIKQYIEKYESQNGEVKTQINQTINNNNGNINNISNGSFIGIQNNK